MANKNKLNGAIKLHLNNYFNFNIQNTKKQQKLTQKKANIVFCPLFLNKLND